MLMKTRKEERNSKMPIKFFEPANPRLPKEIMRMQDEFNVFEYKAADSIGKVYVTAYDDDGRPQVMLWCHYKSKADDVEEE